MEKRISRIDSEHSKYVRATVRRLEYMLNNDDNVKGNVVKLLGMMTEKRKDMILEKIAGSIQLNDFTIISENSMYKKRGKRKTFEDTIEVDMNIEEDLTAEEILKLNKNKTRYSKSEIEEFVIDKMKSGVFSTDDYPITTENDFELLILAYDHSIRRKSPYQVRREDNEIIVNGKYSYPRLTFELKEQPLQEETEDSDDTIL
jgi:hypothetical protein